MSIEIRGRTSDPLPMLARRGSLLLSLFLLGIPGCQHRSAVPGEDAAVLDGEVKEDGRLLPDGYIYLPDGFKADSYTPEVCKKEQVQEKTYSDPRSNFTLVLPIQFSVQATTISSATSVESAAAATYKGVSAAVVTRAPEKSTATQEMQAIIGHLSADLLKLGAFSTLAQGTAGKSTEGYSDVKEAIIDFSATSELSVSALRNAILASLLLRKESALSNLPSTAGATATEFRARFSLVYRSSKQVAISAAAMDKDEYKDYFSTLSFLVDDLSNGTAIALAGASTKFECDIGTIAGPATADIIWVVDESGSMTDNRQDIVNNANTFFSKALAAGLDFRMGVTGVKKPTSGEIILGKFCSRSSSSSDDDGGEDRFLEPTEQSTFSSCVNNPPYYEGSEEFGLSGLYYGIKRHLPRATSSKSAVRKNAKLAIIIATDEAAMELKQGGWFGSAMGFMDDLDFLTNPTCSLSSTKQTQLKSSISAIVDLVTGVTDSEAKATVHLIGGTCKSSCQAEIPWGYQELVTATGGQSGDVCQKDLSSTLSVIIDNITGSASPRVLKYIPITSSLSVEANGLRLQRSRYQGYDYNAQSNSLTFIKVKVQKGNQVVASYLRFVTK
jgi:hypothetical protein